MLYDGRVGFVIPEYQREYDWSESNITRLYVDTLNGFQRLASSADANAFTFLGTLILVEEAVKEPDYSGESVAIVDGQQRLTTLTILACALTEALRAQQSSTDLAKFEQPLINWLEGEAEERLFSLYRCAIGSQNVSPTTSFPFPRIVRRGDVRAKSKKSSHYASPIGKFLEGFAEYFEKPDKIEYIPPALGKATNAEKLAKNFQLIRGLVGNLNNPDWYEDTESEIFDISWVRYGQCRSLFSRLPDYFTDEGDRNRAIETIIKNEELHGLVRTLMFSAYFCNCVVLTRVTTDDEAAAFDIFDALNTTGEPLTALETVKPRVITFENTKGGYSGSDSEAAFNTINSNLDARFSETSRKQTETKELVVSFALYLEGKKLSKDLAAQRNFLRTSYDGAAKNGEKSARNFIQSLADLAVFRRYYWERDGIGELSRFHKMESVDEVQFLMSLISDMNTSLAIPILSRYWNTGLKNSGEPIFLEVLKAVTAFIVIRRAATGGTAGIDSDFRGIMAPKEGRGANRKFNLCAGTLHNNYILQPEELKGALKELITHKIKKLDKASWVDMVVANPLYNQSKELVRFMNLCAAHQAAPSLKAPGAWEKEGLKVSAHENNFLNFKTWTGSLYATVEHIAPDTHPKSGWDGDLYKDNILRHSLGNLVLLPSKENAAIGGDSWEKKKKFYLAVTERSQKDQAKRIEEAKAAGISFSKKTTELLENGQRLPLLDPLRDVDNWNRKVVDDRGKNIANLCWDIVWPWLN